MAALLLLLPLMRDSSCCCWCYHFEMVPAVAVAAAAAVACYRAQESTAKRAAAAFAASTPAHQPCLVAPIVATMAASTDEARINASIMDLPLTTDLRDPCSRRSQITDRVNALITDHGSRQRFDHESRIASTL